MAVAGDGSATDFAGASSGPLRARARIWRRQTTYGRIITRFCTHTTPVCSAPVPRAERSLRNAVHEAACQVRGTRRAADRGMPIRRARATVVLLQVQHTDKSPRQAAKALAGHEYLLMPWQRKLCPRLVLPQALQGTTCTQAAWLPWCGQRLRISRTPSGASGS